MYCTSCGAPKDEDGRCAACEPVDPPTAVIQGLPADGDRPSAGPDGDAVGTRPRRPRWRTAGSALLVVGLLIMGAVGGWHLKAARTEDPPTGVVRVEVDRPVAAAGEAATDDVMPSLIGLTEDDARQGLLQLGLAGDAVIVEPTPAAGQAGLVLRQEPGPGETLVDTATVAISAPATVPDLIGVEERKARDDLATLGARVVVNAVYDPGATVGTVTVMSPKPGEPLVDAVEVTLAAPPSSVFATTLDRVEDSCGSGEVVSGTVAYDDAFTCSVSAGSDDADVIEWVLNKEVSTFEFVLGQDDAGEPGYQVDMRVLVDGVEATTASAPFGESVPVSVDVLGALRVRIELTSASPACCETVDAVLGVPTFVGGPGAIERLIQAFGK